MNVSRSDHRSARSDVASCFSSEPKCGYVCANLFIYFAQTCASNGSCLENRVARLATRYYEMVSILDARFVDLCELNAMRLWFAAHLIAAHLPFR